jgi:bifunctional non-homologous end joining protein LigD
VVIGGFSPVRGRRDGLGALVVGHHEACRLRYAGRVGTGWDGRDD